MTKKYAFYGTLRLNQGNYKRLNLKKTAKFIANKTIPGYLMYPIGDAYPAVINVVHNPNQLTLHVPSIVVDLFEIDDTITQDYIRNMELGAGYEENTIIVDKEVYILYTMNEYSASLAYNSTVPGGDWVKHITPNKEEIEHNTF